MTTTQRFFLSIWKPFIHIYVWGWNGGQPADRPGPPVSSTVGLHGYVPPPVGFASPHLETGEATPTSEVGASCLNLTAERMHPPTVSFKRLQAIKPLTSKCEEAKWMGEVAAGHLSLPRSSPPFSWRRLTMDGRKGKPDSPDWLGLGFSSGFNLCPSLIFLPQLYASLSGLFIFRNGRMFKSYRKSPSLNYQKGQH